MILEVHYLGNEFVVYDKQANRITDRNILNELAFIQPPGFKSVYKIEVDTTTEPVSLQELAIKINLDNK